MDSKAKAAKTMKGKRFIREEIFRRLSPEMSTRVWSDATARLAQMFEDHPDLPKGVAAHTDNFIFPAAAIYLSLKETAPDEAYDILKVTMKERSTKMGCSIAKMTKIPGFKSFFLFVWDKLSHSMFSVKSGFKNTFYPKKKGEFRMDITECPYHKYLKEAGCPEINILFCNNDVYQYGNLPGLKFTRTKTIGAGDGLCDFKMEICRKSAP